MCVYCEKRVKLVFAACCGHPICKTCVDSKLGQPCLSCTRIVATDTLVYGATSRKVHQGVS